MRDTSTLHEAAPVTLACPDLQVDQLRDGSWSSIEMTSLVH